MIKKWRNICIDYQKTKKNPKINTRYLVNNSKQKREKTSSIFMNIKNAANFYLLEDIPKPSLLPEIAANGYVDVPIKQA